MITMNDKYRRKEDRFFLTGDFQVIQLLIRLFVTGNFLEHFYLGFIVSNKYRIYIERLIQRDRYSAKIKFIMLNKNRSKILRLRSTTNLYIHNRISKLGYQLTKARFPLIFYVSMNFIPSKSFFLFLFANMHTIHPRSK